MECFPIKNDYERGKVAQLISLLYFTPVKIGLYPYALLNIGSCLTYSYINLLMSGKPCRLKYLDSFSTIYTTLCIHEHYHRDTDFIPMFIHRIEMIHTFRPNGVSFLSLSFNRCDFSLSLSTRSPNPRVYAQTCP